MITNFEKITEELSDVEKGLINPLIKGFYSHTESNPITATNIVARLKQGGYSITQPRLRKLVNLLRSELYLPIIATSKGYFVSKNREVIESQIRSLNERANAILQSANGLQSYLDKN